MKVGKKVIPSHANKLFCVSDNVQYNQHGKTYNFIKVISV